MPRARFEWVLWDGQRWAPDEAAVMRLAGETIGHIHEVALAEPDDDKRRNLIRHALGSESRPRLIAMVGLAESMAAIRLKAGAFDADPWLFNVRNGTLDLRTGKVRKYCRENYITKLTAVTYDPEAPVQPGLHS